MTLTDTFNGKSNDMEFVCELHFLAQCGLCFASSRICNSSLELSTLKSKRVASPLFLSKLKVAFAKESVRSNWEHRSAVGDRKTNSAGHGERWIINTSHWYSGPQLAHRHGHNEVPRWPNHPLLYAPQPARSMRAPTREIGELGVWPTLTPCTAHTHMPVGEFCKLISVSSLICTLGEQISSDLYCSNYRKHRVWLV